MIVRIGIDIKIVIGSIIMNNNTPKIEKEFFLSKTLVNFSLKVVFLVVSVDPLNSSVLHPHPMYKKIVKKSNK